MPLKCWKDNVLWRKERSYDFKGCMMQKKSYASIKKGSAQTLSLSSHSLNRNTNNNTSTLKIYSRLKAKPLYQASSKNSKNWSAERCSDSNKRNWWTMQRPPMMFMRMWAMCSLKGLRKRKRTSFRRLRIASRLSVKRSCGREKPSTACS